MHWPFYITIKRKLMLVILLTSAVAVLLACGAFVAYELIAFPRVTLEALSTRAAIIGANSTAALSFESQEEATELLSALKADSHLVTAGLYDKNGALFAKYVRDNSKAQPPQPPGPAGKRFEADSLVVVRPIALNGKLIGMIYLQSDVDDLYARFKLYAVIALLVLGGSLLVASLMSARLQRLVSKPILELADTAKTVSACQDYSLRATKTTQDELGQLTDAFNDMLAHIERTTAALRLDEARLEALVNLNLMTEASHREITDFALEEGVRLTKSTVGYLAFLNDDETVLTMHAWSKTSGAECAISDTPNSYQVADTGLWGEAIRQHHPIITNDCPAPVSAKQDYPAGLVGVRRHLNVPVFDGDRIVALAGVINKTEPYDESDLRELTLLLQGMWRLIQRLRAEAALQEAYDLLELRVEQRTAELQQTNAALQTEIAERQRAEEIIKLSAQELARSNNELEQFAYIASHDLQEPLRMVTSYLQLLERRYKDKLDKDATEFIGYAVDGAIRMSRLIKDLLEYSRVGRRNQPFTRVDCSAVLATVLTNLQTTIQEHHAQVTLAALPAVPGSETDLTQLFQNLISNAIKFHDQQPPRVEITATRQGPDWHFAVRDNGIGIDPQYADRIFVIFQRLHGRDQYPGTGIGLAICKKIVERHGGRIWLESQAGHGATFHFTLPATNPETTPP